MSDAKPRPKPVVPARQRRFVGRQVADVHGARSDVPLIAPDAGIARLVQWLTPAFYIDLGRPCNSACLYCAVPPHEDAQGFTPLSEVPAIIAAGTQVGCDRAIVIGGEPTIYPELSGVLALLRDAGLGDDHIVMTNGLRLAKPGFAAELVGAGVGTFHVSIDTADPAIYDQLSRSVGRHDVQGRGLDAALTSGANVYIYTAVTALNADGLPALAAWIAARARAVNRPPPPWIMAVIKPIGDGMRHADSLLMAPDVAAAAVRRGVQAARDLGLTVGTRNLQACLAPDLIATNVDYYLDDFSVDVTTSQRVTYSHTEYWKKPSAACGQCGHEALCTGIYGEMSARYGDGSYVPLGRQGLK
ncbi:MAG: radical SAM protein [Myxococcales bacterium]|nr:radical SAM protein [Myxococcales bacterium]